MYERVNVCVFIGTWQSESFSLSNNFAGNKKSKEDDKPISDMLCQEKRCRTLIFARWYLVHARLQPNTPFLLIKEKKTKISLKTRLKKKVEESPPWVQISLTFVELPEKIIILRRLFLFTFMAFWSVMNSAKGGPAFQV
ncbi:putative protein CHAPERONE-LIKE PROTEIN OF POR1 [Helianthus annuus]|nr:putative protein CHAPERONE-LIKE PROTEIN OF POR1 [Helianthus annuus]KAJ0563112.1 putative protein CHAPERONE-LIKE PROTEIN OF POR1 [Helianthus annuus]KAJ0728480.1 putative protein CHAPERONE-LIKE PROTEIN OF POR1 [Helianthus annuus]KAJ0731232.1 putative protein CHAPERONE-LIKE PROTEIN OF POR1 [Helianthus annuus]